MTDIFSQHPTHSLSSSDRAVAIPQQGAGSARLVTVARPAPCYAALPSPMPPRILRLPEVMSRVGLRRASIYQHIAAGSFPQQIALGVRSVGWLESEIDTWLAVRINARQVPKT